MSEKEESLSVLYFLGKHISLSQKSLVLVIGGLLALCLISFLLIFRSSSTHIGTSALEAIPKDVPFFLRVNKVEALLTLNDEENRFISDWNRLVVDERAFSLDDLSKFIDQSPGFREVLDERPLYIVASPLGKEAFEYSLLLGLKEIEEEEEFLSAFSKLYEMTEHKVYAETVIYRMEAEVSLFVAFHRGLLIVSAKSLLVENSVRQLNSKQLIESDLWSKLNKAVDEDASVNIFIQQSNFFRLVSFFADNAIKKTLRNYTFCDWLGLDWTYEEGFLQLNGFAITDEKGAYLNVFSGQTPANSAIAQMIPLGASMYVSFTLSDELLFMEQLRDYERQNNTLSRREALIRQYEKTGGEDLEEFFFSRLDREVGVVFTGIRSNLVPQNQFIVAQVKSESEMENQWIKILQSHAASVNKNYSSYHKMVHLDQGISFRVYKQPFPTLFSMLIGGVFSKPTARYFTFYNNYIIFGDSPEALEGYLIDCVLEKTLGRHDEFLGFRKRFPNKLTLFTYFSPYKAGDLAEVWSNSLYKRLIAHQSSALRRMKFAGWSSLPQTEGLFYNTFALQHASTTPTENATAWQVFVGDNVRTKPTVVTNHYDKGAKEVIFQNRKNDLVLISNRGRVKWKIPISGKIISPIEQIDYYKNGKLQYVFNTENKLYIVDRNGNSVENTPFTFRSKASASISVFDYLNTGDYRFFVPTQDKRLYVYDKRGKMVQGFKFGKTEGVVRYPVKREIIGRRDYIFFSDNRKVYLINRLGNTRLDVNYSFEISSNPLYVDKSQRTVLFSEEDGTVVSISITGKVKKRKIAEVSPTHYFLYQDVTGDNVSEYIFSDQGRLQVFNQKGEELFRYTFPSHISYRPIVYEFSRKIKKIGIVLESSSRIFLVNADGTLYDGFPLKGISPFSISLFSAGDDQFSLLVGGGSSFLYNYTIR